MSMRPLVVAAGLLVGGLSLSSPLLACPGESSRAAHASQAVAAAQPTDCGWGALNAAQSSRCCGSSFGSKLLAASVPAGLVAFGLGWLSGGRRRRQA